MALVAAAPALAASAIACVGGSGSEPSGPARISVANSLTTVRLDRPTPKTGVSGEVSLAAAKNEFESFQVVVDAGHALRGVRVTSGKPLRGPGGAVIPARNLTIYREVGYRVGTPGKPPSDNEGGPGLWPDALIPVTDYFYGERRSAFPVDVPAGEKMVAWIDVLVPADQRSGTYRGSVLVQDSSGRLGEVPLTVRVWAFSIPSTSSLHSAFLGDSWQICSAYTGSRNCDVNDPSTWKRRALFVRAGLENRISIPNGFPLPDSGTTRSLFARYAVPLINGTDPSLRLPGAKLTTLGVGSWCIDAANGCLRNWRYLAARYGLSSRLFAYLCDEPGADPSIWSSCAATAKRSDQIWPGLRRLVTTSIEYAKAEGGGRGGALGYIDLLAPVINDMISHGKSTRPSYDEFLDPAQNTPGSARNELWLYTSCLSYGCSGTEDPPGRRSPLAGWPGYAIDEPASQARAMGWLAFEYGATGELYYNTAISLSTAWTDQYVEGGNGDGNLFYPGRPDGGGGAVAIGGTYPIPIESIRLKRIRDGREDYEYLNILAKRGQGRQAMAVVEKLFGPQATAARSTTVDANALEAARSQLAAMIAAGH